MSEMSILTPADVERGLREVSLALGEAQIQNAEIEMSYSTNKAELEIGMARTRLDFGTKSRIDGKNYTETQKDDEALIANQDLHRSVAIDEARVKASRALINMLITRSDIGRSLSSSVKSSMK